MHVLDLRAPGPDHERWRRLCARSAGLEGHADAAAREVIALLRSGGIAWWMCRRFVVLPARPGPQ